MHHPPKVASVSTVRLIVYAAGTATVTILLSNALISTLFTATTARVVALAVVVVLVSITAGLACDPLFSRLDRRSRRHGG